MTDEQDAHGAGERPRPRPRPAAATGTAPPPDAPARPRPRPGPVATRAVATVQPEPEPERKAAKPRHASEPKVREPRVKESKVKAPKTDIPKVDTPKKDGPTADQHTPDQHTPDQHTPDQHTPDQHTPDGERQRRRSLRQRLDLSANRGLRLLTKLVIALVVAAVAAFVLRTYVVAPYYIPSASMEPTLQGGGGVTDDRILVQKISYRVHDPHEGDIVVFNRPPTWQVPDKTLVKRIIGLPGDVVVLRKGLVYVNGLRLTENYVNKACGAAPTKPLTSRSEWRVPMDDYFVMGDNRCNSDDSRLFGPIPRSTIVGRVFLIVWPLSRFGTP